MPLAPFDSAQGAIRWLSGAVHAVSLEGRKPVHLIQKVLSTGFHMISKGTGSKGCIASENRSKAERAIAHLLAIRERSPPNAR